MESAVNRDLKIKPGLVMISDRLVYKMGNKAIFVFVLAALFLVCDSKVGFAEKPLKLSGRYVGYNVILIILDALRPDHLSCYGHAKETSPNIDALAKEGLLFTNAFSQASYTLPSVTSIFTSVYPYSHRVMHILKDKMPDKLQTMAQIFRMYGYNTAWFGVKDDPHSGRAEGLLKGFNEKFQLMTTKGAEILKDNEVVFDWIKKNSQEHFFITIHSYSVHEQFFPKIRFFNKYYQTIPKDFLDLLDGQEKKEWDYLLNMFKENPEKVNSVLGQDLVTRYLMQPYQRGKFNELARLLKTDEQKIFLEGIFSKVDIPFLKSFQDKNLSYVLTLLDSAIYAVDNNMIGELVCHLKENDLFDKTIIIITADHGNIYNEHKKFGHGPWLYDEAMRVPLILRLPNFKKPAVISEFAQSIDILPTTLDLLGIGIPHQAQGISLAELIGGRKNALRNEYVYCQGVPEGTIAIRSKDWKLFLKPGESESLDERLFNLKKDPHELQNVINDEPKITMQLRSRLHAWMKNLVVYQQSEPEFISGINEETRERIKKTGYW